MCSGEPEMLPEETGVGSSHKLLSFPALEKSVLFGSYTCGTGTADSYVDYS